MPQRGSPREAFGCRPAPGSLHHVALGAGDVAKVAGFYRDLLGLVEVARHHDAQGGLRSVWLDLAPAILMIERSAAPPRNVETTGHGVFLMALAAPAAGRAAMEDRLLRQGICIESRTEWTTYFRDPEGNRVAISDYDVQRSILKDK